MRALVGHSGFVGTNLKASAAFDALYDSRTIPDIRGRTFDLVVCAAAPATMWAANKDPEGDRAGIDSLIGHLSEARIGHLVLISTIAVLADAAGGADETSTQFETAKAYGRNRRHLEVALTERIGRVSILRLPALFGAGLKKNFIFDLLNPVPSFLNAEILAGLLRAMPADQAKLARGYFVADPALGMMHFEREAAARAGLTPALSSVFSAAGFTATRFTNSASRFQFYGLHRLWGDIERTLALDQPLLHVASGPLTAGEVHLALTGQAFENDGPPVYAEDMHSRHAAAWGGTAPYLYSAAQTLDDLRAFCAQARP